MAKYLLWQRQVQGHEDARPDDGVEADNLLAHQMDVGRPVFIELFRIIQIADRSQVVGQGIKPYINNVLFINRHRNAPVKGSTGNAQILHALLDEVNHLIAAGNRLDKIRIFLNVLQKAVSVLADLEEISLLGYLLHRTVAVRAASLLVQLQLGPVAFTRRAVQACISSLVNIPLVINAAENLLHYLLMAFFRGADKIVIGDVQHFPQVLKACHDRIYIFNWRNPLFLCLLLDFLPMLVAAGQEEYIIPCQAVEACHRVGNSGAVSVTDVQLGTWIVDWRSDIETFVAQNCFLLKIYLIIFDVFEIKIMPGTWCVPAKTRSRS